MTENIKTCFDCPYHEKIYKRAGGKKYHGQYTLITSYVYCKHAKVIANTLYAEECSDFSFKT